MRKHRWLGAGVGVALLLTTAVSTTYAEGNNNNQQGQQGQGNYSWLCHWFPNFCSNWGPTAPSPAATPELDSLLLFGVGLSGLGGYALTRYRARQRP